MNNQNFPILPLRLLFRGYPRFSDTIKWGSSHMNNPRICPGTSHEWKNVAVTFIFPNFGGYSTPASPACMISLTRCSLHLRICKGSSQMTCQTVTPTIPGHHANSSPITGTCPKAAATCKALCPPLTATWIPPRFDQKEPKPLRYKLLVLDI